MWAASPPAPARVRTWVGELARLGVGHRACWALGVTLDVVALGCHAARVWPRDVAWDELRFGVEIEFVDADPAAVALVDGWTMDPDERQRAMSGQASGGEVKPGKLRWRDRGEIGETFAALRAAGADVNFSCGLHVHVGLEPWGADILLPLIDAALTTQDALRQLLETAEHRRLFAPPVTAAQRTAWLAAPGEDPLRHVGRPQGARCGVNVAAWYEFSTVEIRFPNATLDADAAYRTVQLCLRWVAAVGAGRALPSRPMALADALGVPATGYPPPHPEPAWHRREEALNELMIPLLQPLVTTHAPDAWILLVRATPEGFVAKTDSGDRLNHRFVFAPGADGFVLRSVEGPLE